MQSILDLFKQPEEEDEDPLIIQNPDGTYLELEPLVNSESIEIRCHDEEVPDNDQMSARAIPTLMESVLEMLMKQQCNILCVVIAHFILNVAYSWMGYYFREETIKKLVHLFEGDTTRAESLYYSLVSLDVIVCTVFYLLTVAAYCKKSLHLYQLLMKWIYICFFVQVLLAYINKLNIMLVLLKALTYVYAKFIASLIKGIVQLPRQRID